MLGDFSVRMAQPADRGAKRATTMPHSTFRPGNTPQFPALFAHGDGRMDLVVPNAANGFNNLAQILPGREAATLAKLPNEPNMSLKTQ